MAQPYVGEIRIFAGNFAPAGWAFCEGQLLPISENETLFQLIGTTYGGDGQSTFALPDLRGRIPLHQGNGFIMAETGGVETVTLTTQQIPNHTHVLLGTGNVATGNAPNNNAPQPCATESFNNDSELTRTSTCLVFSEPSMVSTLPVPIQVTLSSSPKVSM